MAFQKYNTIWCNELPQFCKSCAKLTDINDFTDKKGVKWESRKCDECEIKWIKSHQKSVKKDNTLPLRLIYGLLEQVAIKIGITKDEIELIQDKIKSEK